MQSRPGITWLTSLSLDAPLVALVWQNAVSTHLDLPLDRHHRILVFLSVWLGYSADRWFDAWRHRKNVSMRHRFYFRFRWPLLSAWLFVLAAAITLALQTLNSQELVSGFCLAFFSIAISLVAQFGRLGRFRPIVKSVLAASLVTASVLLFAFPENANERFSSIALLLATFTLNCSFIHCWDQAIDAIQETGPGDSWSLIGLRIAIGFALIAFLLCHRSPLFFYALASTLLLSIIHFSRDRLNPETRRTLADICLLTPLAALV